MTRIGATRRAARWAVGGLLGLAGLALVSWGRSGLPESAALPSVRAPSPLLKAASPLPSATPMQTARVEYGTRRDEGTPSGSADASARPGEKSDAQQTLDLVREVLAHMSDAEILDAVAQWTTLDRDSFDAVRDLRVHVERLAEVALGGGTADPAALPGEVVFARSVDVQGRTVLEDRAFHDRVRAIFAVFPTNSAQDAVYARWSRSGDPEFVHFDRYGIVDDIERNYVWLEPDAGWSEGLYQVEIFASDDSLSPLAAGSFEIFPIGSR